MSLADYVYGTIATLVALLGITYEPHIDPLSAAGIVVVGAAAIWLAHTLSKLVELRADSTEAIRLAHVGRQLQESWPILSASLPAAAVLLMAAAGVWSTSVGLFLAQFVGVAALAIVGILTAGGPERSLWRRIVWVVVLPVVGLMIVGLEVAVHYF